MRRGRIEVQRNRIADDSGEIARCQVIVQVQDNRLGDVTLDTATDVRSVLPWRHSTLHTGLRVGIVHRTRSLRASTAL